MTVLFLRTLFVYVAVIGGLRFTGKRQLGELSTSEFAVTILVSELASIPLQDTAVPLLGGAVPLLTLLSVEVLLSCLCRHSRRLRRLLSGNPCVVIKNGQFDVNMLRLLRLSPDDIIEGLRIAGYSRIADVRYAIVETNGQLSVIPYAQHEPLTRADVRLQPNQTGMALVVIESGTIIRHNLQRLGHTENWLLLQCRKHGVMSLANVFLMTLDDCGNIFIQTNGGAS